MNSLFVRQDKSDRISKKSNNIFTIIIVWFILIGIIFRFTNLDIKNVWHDEALTLSRTSGYYAENINREIFNGELINVLQVREYQYKNPDSSFFDVVDILAKNNPQHPPIYYLLLRLWRNIFGQSVATARALSALFGSITLIFVYWLCRELQQSHKISLIAVAIVAVSPIHILYSQEAREYSLWVLSTLVSSIALLVAKRKNKIYNWIIYAISSLASLYIFPFSLFVNIGHGIYITILEKFKLTKQIKYFILSFIFALIGFLPWLFLTIFSWDESGSKWTEANISFTSLIEHWSSHLSRAFFIDFNSLTFKYIVASILFLTIAYSFYLLRKNTPKDTWLFILIFCLFGFLPLASADLIFGGQRSISTRYVLPFILAFQIVISLAYNYYRKKIIASSILILIIDLLQNK